MCGAELNRERGRGNGSFPVASRNCPRVERAATVGEDPVYLRMQSIEAFIADKRDRANLPFPPMADAEICGRVHEPLVCLPAGRVRGSELLHSDSRREIPPISTKAKTGQLSGFCVGLKITISKKASVRRANRGGYSLARSIGSGD
jgi:hypothetical protein